MPMDWALLRALRKQQDFKAPAGAHVLFVSSGRAPSKRGAFKTLRYRHHRAAI